MSNVISFPLLRLDLHAAAEIQRRDAAASLSVTDRADFIGRVVCLIGAENFTESNVKTWAASLRDAVSILGPPDSTVSGLAFWHESVAAVAFQYGDVLAIYEAPRGWLANASAVVQH